MISGQSCALSVPASAQGAACRRHGTDSRRHGAPPETEIHPKLSFTLMVERADVLRVRKAIVCLGGHAVESLRYGPVCGSSCVRLCVGLESGCEVEMSRIVRSVEADGFGRVVSG